jgi:catechol 2,3-dioxygenase-like lactoylglutathione lyase family enzyme
MLLHPGDQFHVGIVVHDFEAARAWLSDTFGYEWGPDMQIEYTMLLPDGPFTYQQRLQYSVTEPRLELVRSVAGTPLQPSSSGLHHVGYWCDDVESTSRQLSENGWGWECGGTFADGSPAWAYHFNPLGVRVELVSVGMKAVGIEGLWAPVAPT